MLREQLGKKLLFMDGAMGTQLQMQGLKPGELPEAWNLEKPEIVQQIHLNYLEAGSEIILTNTFGANSVKWHHPEYTTKQVIGAAVDNVRIAAGKRTNKDKPYYVALDMSSTGKLLEPVGTLPFDEAYEAYKEMVIAGVEAGVDLIYIETMSDTYEVKAAVLAAKENSNLPVFVTMMFDEKGTLLTGGDVAGTVALLEGLRVDAMGMNCGMGPKQMLVLLKELQAYTSLPIILKPNAGLPKQKDGETYYDVEPEEFATCMTEIVAQGACVIGGCCGTTPCHIKAMTEACKGLSVHMQKPVERTIVSSYNQTVELADEPVIIGERINPTGKKRFKEALKCQDYNYILGEGFKQQDAGAHILDVNVGLPDIDEVEMMKEAVRRLQGSISLPLQIDTVNIKAMEAGMRYYNGKPMVNSVNGKQESMDTVFPLIQKYGGVVVGLTLDESGIPATAEGRVAIAEKIIKEAAKYGISKKDIVIDVLTMTISSEPGSAKVTLDALRMVRERFGVRTVLGVSNISFGLPNRPIINSHFYALAMQAGLTAGIINPASPEMMQAYLSYKALMNQDENCQDYMAYFATQSEDKVVSTEQKQEQRTLFEAIKKGRKEDAIHITEVLVQTDKPLDIINAELIPALDEVGKGFETGKVFLPQLLTSAEAAKGAFEVLKANMSETEDASAKKDKIVLATVKGDIHDIGKNIVKVLLENYGYEVIDLGKDVSPEEITECVLANKISLVGLSALMTTTVVSMEETIHMLHKEAPGCKVVVGGAVLNQEYADMIGADAYAKDAMQTVAYAQKHFTS